MSDDTLPAAHIQRLVKHKLNELMAGLGPDAKGKTQEGNVQKEALGAFNESAKIFIHYLTATANDICRDGKRQTISVDDVFRAIEELEFGEFTEPLKQSLEGTTH
jgi:DNA polymerase epsilon subunit 3